MRVASLLALVVLASAVPSQALAQIDRLHGAMRSDANGRYRYETIRPKGYGNALRMCTTW
jgi:protocatechuate 3,4-dioxygenase beta subunit